MSSFLHVSSRSASLGLKHSVCTRSGHSSLPVVVEVDGDDSLASSFSGSVGWVSGVFHGMASRALAWALAMCGPQARTRRTSVVANPTAKSHVGWQGRWRRGVANSTGRLGEGVGVERVDSGAAGVRSFRQSGLRGGHDRQAQCSSGCKPNVLRKSGLQRCDGRSFGPGVYIDCSPSVGVPLGGSGWWVVGGGLEWGSEGASGSYHG